MRLNDLHHKLIAVAKQNPPSDAVPYAFEKRVMAHVSGRPAIDIWTMVTKPLWIAASSCMVVTALCGIWTLNSGRTDTETFEQQLETAVYASVDQPGEDIW